MTPITARLASMGALEEALRGLYGLLEWVCDDCNQGSVEIFTSEVLKLLDGAFPEQLLSQASRERMWEAYHCIRTSPSFACL